jgi:radical SAM-linked protein
MLSESKAGSMLNEKKRLKAMPELVPPKTVRLKFTKIGRLQYISHLDVQTAFQRIIMRACLPVWYTKGFNPHIKLVFSTPLSVGAQSVCEYLDIRIDREMSCEEIKDRLNAQMTDEFFISDVYIPENDFCEIAWASYDISIHTDGADENMAKEVQRILTTSPLTLTKRTKSGEKDVDIIPMINSVCSSFDPETESINIKTTVKASSTEYLNPELMITGLRQTLGILSADPTKEYYSIMRTAIFKEDMSEFR